MSHGVSSVKKGRGAKINKPGYSAATSDRFLNRLIKIKYWYHFDTSFALGYYYIIFR